MKTLNQERFILTIKHRNTQYTKIFLTPDDLFKYIQKKYSLMSTKE